MIKVNEIAFVAHPVVDKQRARDFYEGVLGLKPTMDSDFPEGFWVEYEFGPHTLALSNFWKPLRQPVQTGPTVGLEVDNFEEMVATLQEESVTFVMDSLETPVCHMAVIQDPDGNPLFIHKRKPGRS